MSIKFNFSKTLDTKASFDTAVFLFEAQKGHGPIAKAIDKKTNGFLSAALEKSDSTQMINMPPQTGFKRGIFVPVKKEKGKALSAYDYEVIGGKLLPALEGVGAKKVVVYDEAQTQLAHVLSGFELRAYRFEKYKTQNKKKPSKKIESLTVIHDAYAKVKNTFEALHLTNQGVYLARDLVNEPPNILSPEAYAKMIQAELVPLGVKVEVFDEKKLKSMGMGAILAVGMGSSRPPRMVVMHWVGGSKKSPKKPVALVGKGVTFDTGGISIKPGPGMEEMKMDMGGSAAVVGTIKALALRKSKANVVGIVGLAENMPSHTAYRPADIITSYAGKTIEVLNTDAEGRLVLCDCLTYVQKTYKPEIVIDLATLTGAMMVALGQEYCGTFVNDDVLWKKIDDAGKDSGEKFWRMPLDPLWREEMESPIADLQNMAQSGRYAGACTAAGFLEHFIEDGVKWAHMDIAGTAWSKKDKFIVPKYGSGFGVRTLERFIAKNYED